MCQVILGGVTPLERVGVRKLICCQRKLICHRRKLICCQRKLICHRRKLFCRQRKLICCQRKLICHKRKLICCQRKLIYHRRKLICRQRKLVENLPKNNTPTIPFQAPSPLERVGVRTSTKKPPKPRLQGFVFIR